MKESEADYEYRILGPEEVIQEGDDATYSRITTPVWPGVIGKLAKDYPTIEFRRKVEKESADIENPTVKEIAELKARAEKAEAKNENLIKSMEESCAMNMHPAYSASNNALREKLQQTEKERDELKNKWHCEHCGSDRIYSGPPDCPTCGAPNCCQTRCKVATLERELDALKKERDEARREASRLCQVMAKRWEGETAPSWSEPPAELCSTCAAIDEITKAGYPDGIAAPAFKELQLRRRLEAYAVPRHRSYCVNRSNTDKCNCGLQTIINELEAL